jgi:hypothetical protein
VEIEKIGGRAMKKRDSFRKIVIDLALILFLSMIFAVVFRITQMRVNARVGVGQPTPYPAPMTTSSAQINPTSSSLLPGSQDPYPIPNISQATEVSPTPAIPTATPLITKDGWYLYVDKEVGYSFSYPQNTHIDYGKGPFHPYNVVTLLFRIPNSYGYHGMVIDIQKNPQQLKPEDFARSVFQSNAPTVAIPTDLLSSAETVTISGMPALSAKIPPTLTDFMIFLPYQDKMFKIYPTGDPSNTNDPTNAEALKLFYKIIGTFTFGTVDTNP